MPGELAYIASKGALHQLTFSLSAALIPRGITVNSVNPGATDTGYATGAVYEAVRRPEPQGRWGRPDDAARLIAWLAHRRRAAGSPARRSTPPAAAPASPSTRARPA